MKKLLALLLLCSVASAQTYYNKTTINPLPPYKLGTSGVVPTYLNSYTITGTVTANSTTFVCVTGCIALRVGQGVTGTDGVNLLFPSKAGQLGTLITSVGTGINGATITISYTSNASLTPGTYTITVGKNRWDANSTALVNTFGANAIFAGQASLGNSTWAQQYLSGDCDDGTKVNNCFLMKSGATVNNFWGARSSDAAGSPESNISLYVNDNLSVAMGGWNHYWETILLPGAGVGKETHALESSVFNFSSSTQKLDPYNFDVGGTLENIRLTSGQSGLSDLGTMYNASDALSILPINSVGYETGILFGAGALDEVTTAHPPAVALPAGATGYGITWYRATGYTTPAWNLYATNTTQNGNTFALNDGNATVSIVNASGTGQVFIESGALAMSGTHSAVFSGTGNNTGLDVADATINDPTSSGTTVLGAISHFGQATLTSTSPLTLTTAATLTISGCPVASTNVTITTCQAFRVLADTSYFSGGITGVSGATLSGAATSINADSNFATNINTGTSTGTLTLGQNSATPSSIVLKGPVSFQASTNFSGASWTTTSPVWNGVAMTLNDTTASGTVTTEAAYTLQAPTFTSTGGASTTITNATSLYLAAPTCSGGVVCTNLYSLFAAGKINGTTGLTISGGTVSLNASANQIVNIGTGTNNAAIHVGDGSGNNAIGIGNGTSVVTAIGAWTFNLNTNNAFNINTGSSTGAIHIGDGSGNNTITIGNGTGVITEVGPWTASNATVKMSNLTQTSAAQTGTVCSGAAGLLTVDTTTTCLISSLRWKEHISPLNVGLDEIMKFRPVSYDLKPKFNPAHLGRQIGLVAEEVQKIDPRLVGVGADGIANGVRYQQLTALLVKGEQELEGEVRELRAQNALLMQRVAQLESGRTSIPVRVH